MEGAGRGLQVKRTVLKGWFREYIPTSVLRKDVLYCD